MLFFVLGRSRAGAGPEPGRSHSRPRELRPGRSRGRAGAGPERSGVSARAGPEPGRSRARGRAGRKREPGPGRSRARAERSERQSRAGAGEEPGRSRAGAGPESERGGSGSRGRARAERASVRWRTAGATCSAAWPPTLPWSESQRLARVVQSGTGRSRLELQPGLCGARAGDVEPASQSPGAGETSIVVHTVYVPILKL